METASLGSGFAANLSRQELEQEKAGRMNSDVIFIGLTVVLFVLMLLYVSACESLE